jgi:hypothetical protein
MEKSKTSVHSFVFKKLRTKNPGKKKKRRKENINLIGEKGIIHKRKEINQNMIDFKTILLHSSFPSLLLIDIYTSISFKNFI